MCIASSVKVVDIVSTHVRHHVRHHVDGVFYFYENTTFGLIQNAPDVSPVHGQYHHIHNHTRVRKDNLQVSSQKLPSKNRKLRHS